MKNVVLCAIYLYLGIYPMVANSYAKLVENFANYFFKTESKNKYFIILNCTRLMLEKSLEVIQKGRPSGFSLET